MANLGINLAGGTALPIDIDRLVETRLLVQANSGGGKSWALRRILEQTATRVQQLVIDPEGEFATLREKFDFVICAPHDADAIASPQTAALLARRLLETGVSAILDIYDLKAHERQLFVKRFLEALINAPKSLWHPVLVVLDEAHVFAPQTGGADAQGAVIDVATRGRKRGQCLIAATQRLAKLHKDVAAELLNKLIGRTGLDVDVKRAAEELGMTPKDATEKLRSLEPGKFFCFGPALSKTVEPIAIGPVETTHPKSGQRLMQAPPAPSKRILSTLAKLADLTTQAAEEAKDLESAKEIIQKLQRENAKLTREKGKPETVVDQNAIDKAVEACSREYRTEIIRLQDAVVALGATLEQIGKLATGQPVAIRPEVAERLKLAAHRLNGVKPSPPAKRTEPKRSTPQTDLAIAIPAGDFTPNKTQQRILDAVAWYESMGNQSPSNIKVGAVALIDPTGGYFSNTVGPLSSAGLIERGDGCLRLTDAGRDLANPIESPGTLVDYHEILKARVRKMRSAGNKTIEMLSAIIAYDGESISTEQLGQDVGIDHTGGYFSNTIGPLSTAGLITRKGGILTPTDVLFPEGLA